MFQMSHRVALDFDPVASFKAHANTFESAKWFLCTSNRKLTFVLSTLHRSCRHSFSSYGANLRAFLLGTPRQGSLAASTRGKIKFFRSVSPEILDGLDGFSHVWILFIFHENTISKHTKAQSERYTFPVRFPSSRNIPSLPMICRPK